MHFEAVQLLSMSHSFPPSPVLEGLSTLEEGFFTEGNNTSSFFRMNAVTLQNSLGHNSNNYSVRTSLRKKS